MIAFYCAVLAIKLKPVNQWVNFSNVGIFFTFFALGILRRESQFSRNFFSIELTGSTATDTEGKGNVIRALKTKPKIIKQTATESKEILSALTKSISIFKAEKLWADRTKKCFIPVCHSTSHWRSFNIPCHDCILVASFEIRVLFKSTWLRILNPKL